MQCALRTFLGYMLKILAALVLVTATNLFGSIFPETTPFSQIMDMRSSTPLTPFGILRKSSFPSCFCSDLNVQLSVPVHWRSSLNHQINQKSSSSSKNIYRHAFPYYRNKLYQTYLFVVLFPNMNYFIKRYYNVIGYESFS